MNKFIWAGREINCEGYYMNGPGDARGGSSRICRMENNVKLQYLHSP